MRNLETMGIRTVVNLRSLYSDLIEIGDAGLGYEHIRFKVWHPQEKQIVKFLQIVTDNRRTRFSFTANTEQIAQEPCVRHTGLPSKGGRKRRL